MSDRPHNPLKYEPRFEFNGDTNNYDVLGPSALTVAQDIQLAFLRDVEGKLRKALVDLGWMPPEIVGEFKAAFRANMIRRALPGENIDAEIDRVFSILENAR